MNDEPLSITMTASSGTSRRVKSRGAEPVEFARLRRRTIDVVVDVVVVVAVMGSVVVVVVVVVDAVVAAAVVAATGFGGSLSK